MQRLPRLLSHFVLHREVQACCMPSNGTPSHAPTSVVTYMPQRGVYPDVVHRLVAARICLHKLEDTRDSRSSDLNLAIREALLQSL